MFKKERESNEHDREFGVSTEPGGSVMDQRQESGKAEEGVVRPETQVGNHDVERKVDVNRNDDVNVDPSALDDQPDELDQEPKQVEERNVFFYPLKDFEGRVNDRKFEFKKGQLVEVSRDVANMLTEDESRGYIREI